MPFNVVIFNVQNILSMKAVYQHLPPISKIGVIALVTLVSVVVALLLSAILAIPVFGIDAFTKLVSSSMQFNSSNLGLLKYLQVSQSIGMFIIPALILALLFGNGIGSYLMLNKKPILIAVFLAILVVISASPIINVLGMWNAKLSLPSWMSGIESWMRQSEESAAELTELFVRTDKFGVLLINVFVVALVPAIGEEFLFRGVIQRVIGDWSKNKHVAIWITAILFSALHLQFYGFLPRALLGAMFGYLLVWSGNLWLPVIAHFVNNGLAVVAYYLYDIGSIKIDPDTIGTNSSFALAPVISLIIVLSLFAAFYYQNKNPKRLEI